MGTQKSRASVSARTRRAVNAKRLQRDQRRGGFNLQLMVIIFGITIAVAVPVFLWIQDSEFGSSAQESLRTAETLYTRGKVDEALALIDRAERSDPSTEDYLKIANLRRQITATRSLVMDLPQLKRAGNRVNYLSNFEDQYLKDSPQRREACREMIKLVEEWNEKYGEVCSRHASKVLYQEMIDKMAAFEEKYRAPAMLAEPDTAEDVLFAAARPTRRTLRRYKFAVALLDAWLAKNPGADREAEVLEQRNQYHTDCSDWIVSRVIDNRTLESKGHLMAALDEMRIVVEECALPASIGLARERLREVERKVAASKSSR